MTESRARASQTGYALVAVVGHPAYYPRFGFQPAADLAIREPWGVPPEA